MILVITMGFGSDLDNPNLEVTKLKTKAKLRGFSQPRENNWGATWLEK
jgi:hypothetical protein